MNHLAFHPEDVRRLRNWLRSHLICILAIAACLALDRCPLDRSHDVEAGAQQHRHLQMPDFPTEMVADASDGLPAETELVYLTTRRPNPIAPHGWRRTDLGWEDVSTWRRRPRPLGEIVMAQEAREPSWMKWALEELRQVPPLAFAMLQIAAISGIIGVSRTERREELRLVPFPN
jgi:hypothetical protein